MQSLIDRMVELSETSRIIQCIESEPDDTFVLYRCDDYEAAEWLSCKLDTDILKCLVDSSKRFDTFPIELLQDTSIVFYPLKLYGYIRSPDFGQSLLNDVNGLESEVCAVFVGTSKLNYTNKTILYAGDPIKVYYQLTSKIEEEYDNKLIYSFMYKIELPKNAEIYVIDDITNIRN
jgi:hypothetical protein